MQKMNEKNYKKDKERESGETEKMYAIKTTGLTKQYGKNRGIAGIDMRVEQGDFFGFIGPNGAGKSTTIRCLLGLITPTEGEAYMLGMPCARSQKQLLERVGYMPSDSCFYDGIRAGDMIRLAADLRQKDCREQAGELAERLQLDSKKRVDELSLGNRKKVSIICALQHEPELYILDEPTSGLDPLMQQEFFRLLKERNEKGATIFLSSHVLSEIQKYCKNAAIIREGCIIRSGSVEELAATDVRRVHMVMPQGTEDFLYQGSIRDLLNQISERELLDLTITEPTLDEVVLRYYEKEEKNRIQREDAYDSNSNT